MPTQQQLNARLNPTAVNIKVPTTGLFRPKGELGILNKRVGDTVTHIDLVDLLIPDNAERLKIGNYGAQMGVAQQRLKEKYGIDIASLPEVNMGDLSQSRASTIPAGQKLAPRMSSVMGNLRVQDINQFLGVSPSQLQQIQQNTQQNQLDTPPNLTAEQQARFNELVSAGAPQDVALNAVNQITPQTIEDGIKNLRPPENMTPEQQKAWDNAVALIPKGNNNIITTDTSKDASPIDIATSTSDTTKADSTAAGADATNKSIQDYIKLLTPPESDESKGVKSLIDTINTELEGLKGRGATQLSTEEEQGVNAKKQLLQNAKTELDQKLAEYKAIQAKYQALNADIEGKPITMSSIIGSRAQVNRTMQAELNVKASEIAMIQANVAGARGNLDLAQDAANRAVDLKFQDAKDVIEIRLQQLELLQGQLDKNEAIRADAVELYLSQQADALDAQQANERDKNSTLLNLMQKYNDAGITLSDTIESADRKITANSAIYRKKEVGGGVGTGGDDISTPVTKRFSKTQIAKGVENSGLSFEEFNQLPEEEANKYINGDKIGEQKLKSDIDLITRMAVEQETDEKEILKDIRAIIVASGFNADTFDGGKYKEKNGFWSNTWNTIKSQFGVGVPGVGGGDFSF